MARRKISRSRARKKAYQRVLLFPEAKGKIISDYFTVEIKFQDKTSLVFDLEPCVQVFPELINWRTGNYRLLKRWKPIHSRTSRV
jgi:hypothetical protein